MNNTNDKKDQLGSVDQNNEQHTPLQQQNGTIKVDSHGLHLNKSTSIPNEETLIERYVDKTQEGALNVMAQLGVNVKDEKTKEIFRQRVGSALSSLIVANRDKNQREFAALMYEINTDIDKKRYNYGDATKFKGRIREFCENDLERAEFIRKMMLGWDLVEVIKPMIIYFANDFRELIILNNDVHVLDNRFTDYLTYSEVIIMCEFLLLNRDVASDSLDVVERFKKLFLLLLTNMFNSHDLNILRNKINILNTTKTLYESDFTKLEIVFNETRITGNNFKLSSSNQKLLKELKSLYDEDLDKFRNVVITITDFGYAGQEDGNAQLEILLSNLSLYGDDLEKFIETAGIIKSVRPVISHNDTVQFLQYSKKLYGDDFDKFIKVLSLSGKFYGNRSDLVKVNRSLYGDDFDKFIKIVEIIKDFPEDILTFLMSNRSLYSDDLEKFELVVKTIKESNAKKSKLLDQYGSSYVDKLINLSELYVTPSNVPSTEADEVKNKLDESKDESDGNEFIIDDLKFKRTIDIIDRLLENETTTVRLEALYNLKDLYEKDVDKFEEVAKSIEKAVEFNLETLQKLRHLYKGDIIQLKFLIQKFNEMYEDLKQKSLISLLPKFCQFFDGDIDNLYRFIYEITKNSRDGLNFHIIYESLSELNEIYEDNIKLLKKVLKLLIKLENEGGKGIEILKSLKQFKGLYKVENKGVFQTDLSNLKTIIKILLSKSGKIDDVVKKLIKHKNTYNNDINEFKRLARTID